MNFVKWFFKNKEQDTGNQKHTPKENTHLDVIISLNTDLQIDVSLFINDDPKSHDMDNFEYANFCAQFLSSCFTEHIQEKLFSIMDENVKDNMNYSLINDIEKITQYYNAQMNSINNKNQKTYIKPTAVFSYHKS
jgi:hypothetical protein